MIDPINQRNPFQQSRHWLGQLQNQLERCVKTEQQEVLVKPSRFWPRAITWTLIGGTLFGHTWLSFAQT